MELEKKQIHMNREKGRAVNQITLDDDYNIPDYKPDLIKVIKEKGEIRFEDTNINSGHIFLKGVLIFQLLYRSDQEGKRINTLKGEIPFQETLSIDGVEELDPLKINGKIEDISVSVINSRKLSIRALAVLSANAQDIVDEALVTGLADEDGYEIERNQRDILQLVVSKKDTFRMKQEILLPSNKPNIEEILFSSVQLRSVESRLKDGEIEISGEVLIYVLYSGEEEENRLQWLETSVPLQGKVDCNVCENGQIYKVSVENVSAELEAKTDADGEERQMLLDMVVDLDIRIWQEEQLDVVEDIYSLDEKVIPEFTNAQFEKLLIKNDSKCRVLDRVELDGEQDGILQICCSAEKVEIEQAIPKDGGLTVEGTLFVEILYMTSDESSPIGAKRAYIPFSQELEAPGVTKDSRVELTGSVDLITTILAESHVVEVKAVININLIAFEKQEIAKITQIRTEELDIQELQKRPGIVGYIVRPKDRLFTVAKENHTTVSNLMETNDLPNQQIWPGQKLLIVKTIG